MAASVQDMGIDHGRADILVPKEFLDGSDVIACFKQMRGKGMSEGVTTDMLNYGQALGRSNRVHLRICHGWPGIELSHN